MLKIFRDTEDIEDEEIDETIPNFITITGFGLSLMITVSFLGAVLFILIALCFD